MSTTDTLLLSVLMEASVEAIQRGRPVPDFLRDLARALSRYADELEEKGVCSI